MQPSDLPFRRIDPRSEVPDAQVRGILVEAHGKAQSPFAVWDISDQGLRLWVPTPLQRGNTVKATIAKPFVFLIEGEVRWCREAVEQGGYFVGVQVLTNFARLESLHAEMVAKQTEADAEAQGRQDDPEPD